jgi:hypothetical protein
MSLRRIETGRRVASLLWDGDNLVDFAAGPDRWHADGTADIPFVRRVYGGPFDHAVVSPSGRFRVVYAERGTKALLLDESGDIVRELNRSYYHAEDFDYPIALAEVDGREVVVHCPEHYNVLEVEDAATGERLTEGRRSPIDVFHSRLSASPDGRRLLVAGWVWQPYGECVVLDLERALSEASALDESTFLPVCSEVESACWLDNDLIAVAASSEEPPDQECDKLGQGQLGVWSIREAGWRHRSAVSHPIGTMLACGTSIVSLYEHPRLLEPTTAALIAEWPEVDAGRKSGSYGVTHVPTPVTAIDPGASRLAIAQANEIVVIDLAKHQ